MIRLEFSIELDYEIDQPGSDFIFSIHAAKTNYQSIVTEYLNVNQNIELTMYADPVAHTRLLRLKAMPGFLKIHYSGAVDLRHYSASPNQISETPVANLPGEVLTYLYPSRYCQSDFLQDIAIKEFGKLPQGYSRIQAIRDWVLNYVAFRPNSSTAHTTAIDTYLGKAGVCRDFAHLMIALCRALSIPARFVTGIDYGSDPILGPTDFHAYVEVYLDGRWYIFDPSGVAIPMGFLRFSTGRDAADTAIATIFGSVRGSSPMISIRATPNAQGILELPQHVPYALSTDG
jgi:transglutaminase-like putative cysteine protease